MKNKPNKQTRHRASITFITGPIGSGKSEIANGLAKRFGGFVLDGFRDKTPSAIKAVQKAVQDARNKDVYIVSDKPLKRVAGLHPNRIITIEK